MSIDFEAMEKKIDNYFENISYEQLNADVKRAGYSFYKNLDIKIFSGGFYSEPEMEVTRIKKGKPNLIFETISNFTEYSYPDRYFYKLAA